MSHLTALIVPLAIWGMLLWLLVAILFAWNDGIKQLRRLHQIPCDRCRYNTDSPYLRCPIHPLIAFSEEAIYCRDFEAIPKIPSTTTIPALATKHYTLIKS